MKTCARCKKEKPLEEFGRQGKGGTRKHSYCLKCNSEYVTERNKHARLRVIDAYGGACTCCGEREPIFLTVDHVNGDGGGRNRKVYGGVLYHRIIREGFPETYTILCFNCNTGRHINGGVCPHQT